MASRALLAGLSELDNLISNSPDRVLWSGPSSNTTLQDVIDIPLRLPAGGRYQLSASGTTLTVASIGDNELLSFGFAPEVAGRVVTQFTNEGVQITNFGSRRFDTLLLLKNKITADPTAVSVASTSYPLNLLDEYSDLRNLAQRGLLTPEQRQRRDQILRELGADIERGSLRQRYPSYRSTPRLSGESRGGGSRTVSG